MDDKRQTGRTSARRYLWAGLFAMIASAAGVIALALLASTEAQAICNETSPCVPEIDDPAEEEPKNHHVPAKPTKGGLARPWAVVLCKFTDHQEEPFSSEYYRRMYSELGEGQGGLFDYWRDISYKNITVKGTVVKGWYTLPMTLTQYNGLNRTNRIQACAAAAVNDIDFSKYVGVITIQNLRFNPDQEATTKLAAPVGESDTTLTVESSSGFPSPPFPAFIMTGKVREEVNVTAVDGNTWTVTRGYEGDPVSSHGSGDPVTQPREGDFGFAGRGANLGGNPFPNLALVDLQPTQDPTGAAHEMGHGFGLNHSRALSKPTQDYGDKWDIMSAYNVWDTSFAFLPQPYKQFGLRNGPGLNAVNLETLGWLPDDRRYVFNQDGPCGVTTLDMAALNHPEADGYLQLKIPATRTINPGPNAITGDYYSIEFRSKTSWDIGIPNDAVLIHLHGKEDGISYLVDDFVPVGDPAHLTAGAGYVDASNNFFVVVDSIDRTTNTAKARLGNCPSADVSVATSRSPQSVTGGDTVTYTVTVTNNGPSPADVLLQDTYPEPVRFGSVGTSKGRCEEDDAARLVECRFTQLQVNETATVTIKVYSDFEGGTLTNRAHVMGLGNPSFADKESVDTTTAADQTADVDLSLGANANRVHTNGPVVYTAKVHNKGPAPATGVSVTGHLPSGGTVDSAAASPGSCSPPAGTSFSCVLGTIESGDDATVTVKVTAPPTAQTMTAKVSVMANVIDPNGANNTKSVDTTVEVAPAPEPPPPGGNSTTSTSTTSTTTTVPPSRSSTTTTSSTIPQPAPPEEPDAVPPSLQTAQQSGPPGSEVTLTGQGFPPNEVLSIMFESTPVFLGTVTSDASGAFETTVTIPADAAPGVHHVVVSSADGTRTETAVVVTAPASTGALAFTGSPMRRNLLLAALAFLLANLGLLGVYGLRPRETR